MRNKMSAATESQALNALRQAYDQGYDEGFKNGVASVKPPITAYLVGGPKNGEILAHQHGNTIVVPIRSNRAWTYDPAKMGFNFPDPNWATGEYRRDRQLVGKNFPPNSYIYVWQGE